MNPAPVAPPTESKLYEQCLNGYNYRDQLVAQEFFWMSQLFVVFLTGVGAVVALLGSVKPLTFALVLLLGVAGFFMIRAFLRDLRANFMCKAALRWVMRDLEDGKGAGDRSYWQIINAREQIVLEREAQPAVTRWFILAGYVYLFTWSILSGIVLIGLCVGWLPGK